MAKIAKAERPPKITWKKILKSWKKWPKESLKPPIRISQETL
jgi:hypothetical protein